MKDLFDRWVRRSPIAKPVPKQVELMVTLLPSFPHFNEFAFDTGLAGIRINSAALTVEDVRHELSLISKAQPVPLYFDIKGRQLRVTQVYENHEYLDITLTHPISVQTPTMVLFKAGDDRALLREVSEDGYRLKFYGGPNYLVNPGESLYIRHPSLEVGGEQFVPAELEKIKLVKAAGLTKWFLSYVESKRDVDEFLELVGRNAPVMLKIESKKGLEYVAREFKKRDNLRLVAAKGDMYVELDRPDQILAAQKLIIEKDPEANAGSRMMLSVVNKVPEVVNGSIRWRVDANKVPSNADFEQVAWLYEVGYRSFMLCDELCLRADLLYPAVSAMCAFRDVYTH